MTGVEDKDKEFKALLDRYLGRAPVAYKWVINFWQLGHDWDDIIDIPERRADNKFIGQVLNKYIEVLSHPFYHRYLDQLYPVVKVVHHIFLDSQMWENSEESWKSAYSDVMRCCGSALICAVVEIVVREETGSIDLAYEAVREVSELAKTCAWMSHHKDDGTKI